MKFKIPPGNIILEPAPKNTLPAIGLCARLINLKDPQSNLLIMPSDHFIKNNAGFLKTIVKSLKISLRGRVCLIGIKPTKPSSAYGYIETGEKIRQAGLEVKSFYEKPSINKAVGLWRKKNVFWNSGIFCFRSDRILAEVKKHSPDIHRQLMRIKGINSLALPWEKMKSISIDYGILEKADNLAMVKASFSWCDLGSWDALYELLPKDKNKNVILADYVGLDNTNTFVYSKDSGRTIAAVGLDNLVIVDTPDALLVCRKDNSQDIKRLVEILIKKRKTCV